MKKAIVLYICTSLCLGYSAQQALANKQHFVAQVCAVATQQDKQLLNPLLCLFRDYCLYQKELAICLHIPDEEKKEIVQKMHLTQSEINEFFTKQQHNQCFMIKVMKGMKEFEVYLLNVKLSIIQALFEEINKGELAPVQKKKENPCTNV